MQQWCKVDVVFKELLETKNLGFWSHEWGAHSSSADEMLPKLFTDPYHGKINSVMSTTILLEPLFFLIKVLMLRNVMFFFYHCITLIIFKEKWFNGIIIFTNPSARAGYDTIFKRSLTGLNSEFSFS